MYKIVWGWNPPMPAALLLLNVIGVHEAALIVGSSQKKKRIIVDVLEKQYMSNLTTLQSNKCGLGCFVTISKAFLTIILSTSVLKAFGWIQTGCLCGYITTAQRKESHWNDLIQFWQSSCFPPSACSEAELLCDVLHGRNLVDGRVGALPRLPQSRGDDVHR